MLAALGIDPVAETVYRTVLRHPGCSAADIAARLGWAPEEVDQALERLVRLELLCVEENEWAQLHPVSPGVGLSALLSRAEAKLTRRQRQLEVIRPAVNALVAEYADT